MKVVDLGGHARGCVPRRSPRSEASGYKMTRANVRLDSCRCGRVVAMRTSMSQAISPDDLSFPAASQSEDLDKASGLQYGLELVIPMSSRRLETR
jgi:phage terminase large subunit-like protein